MLPSILIKVLCLERLRYTKRNKTLINIIISTVQFHFSVAAVNKVHCMLNHKFVGCKLSFRQYIDIFGNTLNMKLQPGANSLA